MSWDFELHSNFFDDRCNKLYIEIIWSVNQQKNNGLLYWKIIPNIYRSMTKMKSFEYDQTCFKMKTDPTSIGWSNCEQCIAISYFSLTKEDECDLDRSSSLLIFVSGF